MDEEGRRLTHSMGLSADELVDEHLQLASNVVHMDGNILLVDVDEVGVD